MVYDITVPQSPQLAGVLPVQLPDSLTELLVVDTTAYLVVTYPYEDYSRTKVLRADVSNPAQPVLDTGFVWDVDVFALRSVDGVLHVPSGWRTFLYTPPVMTSAGQLPVAGFSYWSDPAGLIVDHSNGDG